MLNTKLLYIFSLLLIATDAQRIKFSQTLIDPAIEGKTYSISAAIDEPIICTNMPVDSPIEECRVTVIFDNPAPDTLSISPCYIEWTARNWHETRTVQIRMIGHFRNVADRDVKLTARPVLSKSEYYSGFIPSPIIVRFRALNTATCSSTGDPHYTTFDGYYFHFYGRGKSVLAHVPGELEVQTITQGDGYSRNCAIAISEGGNYVALSVCTGNGNIQPLTIFKDTSATPKVIAYSGTNYQVDYPSGLSVKFQSWGNNANVYLTLPGRYYKHPALYGLCGNWNGVSSDEGIPAYVMWEWVNLSPKHQIQSGSDMDLFYGVNDAKVMRTYNTGDKQFLNAVKATCDYVPPVYVRPILNNPNAEDITELIRQLTITGNGQNTGSGTNFVVSVDPVPTNDDDDIPPVDMGPTRAELETMCNTIAQRSELVNCVELTKRHIANCIHDLALFQNIMVVQESLESARTECLQQQLIKTVDDTQANVVINTICMANCPIYSKCVDNQCVCTDSGMKGPLCSIPVNAVPELNDIKPRVVDIYHWQEQDATQIMFSMSTRYIMPDDKLQCIVNNTTYPANYMSETNVYCRLPLNLFISDSGLTSNLTVYLQVNSYIIAVPRYITAYNNPCVQCDPNGNTACTRRTEQTCFPKGFKSFTPLVHGIGMTQQSCSRPIVPCQYCINDTTRVDWFSDSSCMPYFVDKNIYVQRVEETDTVIQLTTVNLTNYIQYMRDPNNNLWIDNLFINPSVYGNLYWRIRNMSQNISYVLDCQDIFSRCVFKPILTLNTITELVLYNIFLDLMVNTTVIDTLNYNLVIINNKDNDPTTSTTSSTSTSSGSTSSISTSSTSTSSISTGSTSTVSVTTSSTTTSSMTTHSSTQKTTSAVITTEPVTEIVYTPFEPTLIITSTTTSTPYFTDEPVIVQGASNQVSSMPLYAIGIIGAFAIMIMIIGFLMYQSRRKKQIAHEDKQDVQFMLDYQTTSDKDLSFINPLFVKPEYMELDPGLINPLYDAMMNMSEGTYKVVCTDDIKEHILIVRGANGNVETYPIRQHDNRVVINTLYSTTQTELAFNNIDSLITYYTTCENTFPLSCKLTRVCPNETYSYGNVYSYNNTNIKNTPVAIETGEC